MSAGLVVRRREPFAEFLVPMKKDVSQHTIDYSI